MSHEKPEQERPEPEQLDPRDVLAGLRRGNRRGGPVQSLGEILAEAAERGRDR